MEVAGLRSTSFRWVGVQCAAAHHGGWPIGRLRDRQGAMMQDLPLSPLRATTPGAPAALLEPLVDAFERACLRVAPVCRCFAMAGTIVRFAIAGQALAAALLRAFDHLAVAPDRPADLSVRLWDATETGIARPLPDLRGLMAEHAPFGDGLVARDAAGSVGAIGFQSPRVFALLDPAAAILAGCVTDAQALSFFEIGKPLQPLLFHWHAAHGTLPLHAALVSAQGRGMILGGKGGSGKSTSALACARAGLDFLGDDYVGIGADGPRGMTGHSLYASAWLEDGHSRVLPWLTEHPLPGTDSGERKQSFSVLDALPGRLAQTTRIVAIGLPRVTAEPVAAARRIAPGEALRRLAPSSILQIPFLETPQAMAAIGRLVRACPCYELTVGPDLPSIARCVGRILSGGWT